MFENRLWENFSLFGYVSAPAPLPRMKFKSALAGLVIHFFVCVSFFGQSAVFILSVAILLSYLPLSAFLSGLLCSDDITPWRWLRPILSCSCFVFSSASGLSQMEAAVDCMPQKAGN